MNIFSLLTHAGLLVHMGKSIEEIIENLFAHKESFSTVDEFKKILDDLLQLLGAGLIKLPDDVTKKITLSLNGVKENLDA